MLLESAQAKVTLREFSNNTYLRRREIRGTRLCVGPLGFHIAAHTAEKVDLPGGRDGRVVALVIAL